jgi:hypothetical protein
MQQYLTMTGVQSAGRLSMRRFTGSTIGNIPRATHHSSKADHLDSLFAPLGDLLARLSQGQFARCSCRPRRDWTGIRPGSAVLPFADSYTS